MSIVFCFDFVELNNFPRGNYFSPAQVFSHTIANVFKIEVTFETAVVLSGVCDSVFDSGRTE